MNRIWVFLIIFCLIFGVASGNEKEMSEALLNSPSEALNLLLTIGGLIIFYSGIFQIALDAKVISYLSRYGKKITKWLFPNISDKSPIHEYVTANIMANFLGLGIAATPVALKALEEMKKLSPKEEASDEMITLILLNITSFTIFPLTVLSLREKYDASINLILIPVILLITFMLTVCSLLINKLLCFRYLKKKMVGINE